MTNRLLLADFGVPPNFDDSNRRYERFLANGKPRFRRLVDGLIIQDEIIIPTHDFLGAAVLVGVLGERAVRELLEHDALRFVHVNGTTAYVGNGGGLIEYEVSHEDGTKPPYWMPTDEAVAWALSGLNAEFDRKGMAAAIVEKTKIFDLKSKSKALIRQTYEEVQSSHALTNWFGRRNTNLARLYGVKPTTVMVYGGPDVPPDNAEAATLLRMLHCNVELAIALDTGCRDLSTENFAGLHLASKIAEYNSQYPHDRAVSDLVSISGVPDIVEGILARSVSIGDLLKLRRGPGVEFRAWFHEHCRKDTVETAKRYAELLKATALPNSLPGRILRFATTTGLGLIPIVGGYLAAAAGAIDTFALDSMAKGPSPKVFLDRLATLKQRRPTGRREK